MKNMQNLDSFTRYLWPFSFCYVLKITIEKLKFEKHIFKREKAERGKMSDPRLKQLKIQTGVVRRCGKEKLSYRKEADMQKAKVDKMKADGREEIEIRKMNECVQESLMMIPDCHRRLEKSYDALKGLVTECEAVSELAASEELANAKKAMQEAIEHFKAE